MPKILVVGCGGAGNNTVSRLARMGLAGAKTVAINTDNQHLKTAQADEKILIGQKLTRGMGAGGDPKVGRKAAELAAAELESMLRGADLVFVIAGLGGGTGTGSAPVVARLAKERGAIVVAMVTTPFHLERARIFVAEEGLEALSGYADTSIVMDNNRLLECAPHLPFQHAFLRCRSDHRRDRAGHLRDPDQSLAHQSGLCRCLHRYERRWGILHVCGRGQDEEQPGEDRAHGFEKSPARRRLSRCWGLPSRT